MKTFYKKNWSNTHKYALNIIIICVEYAIQFVKYACFQKLTKYIQIYLCGVFIVGTTQNIFLSHLAIFNNYIRICKYNNCKSPYS